MIKKLKKKLKTFRLINLNGERFLVIVESDTGLPLYYPNLFITQHLRQMGKSTASIEGHLTAIKILYLWMNKFGVDVEKRFKNGTLLKRNELSSLADFCKNRIKQMPSQPDIIKFPMPPICPSTHYVRISYISKYLKFLSYELTNSLFDDVERMLSAFSLYRPRIKNYSKRFSKQKAIPQKQIDKLLMFTRPGNERNPFKNIHIQFRNHLMVKLLLATGIRRAELLGLRVEDISTHGVAGENYISVIRNHDDPYDPRKYPVNQKTYSRHIPINYTLAKEITKYISMRSTYPEAENWPYLFVSHKPGITQGRPLSNSAFGSLIGLIKKIDPSLKSFTAHGLRHTAATDYAKCLDQDPKLNQSVKKKILDIVFGWSFTGDTADTYIQAYIEELAGINMRKYQEKFLNLRSLK